MKQVYKYYKNRLVEISGRNRSLYSKKINKKNAYDVGKILHGDYEGVADFVDFLFNKKRTEFPLVDKASKERILRNLGIKEQKFGKRSEATKAIHAQVNDLRLLKREIEEFSQETGRYEMFLGYPFVEGSIGRDYIVRAPLLLFPITLNIENDTTVTIEKKANEPIQVNKVFLLAYAQRFKRDVDEMKTEFDSIKDIETIVKYLRGFGFKMAYEERKGTRDFSKAKEPMLGDPIEIKHYAVIGRFPLANAIYNDYKALEGRKATEAIRELLESKESKKTKKPSTNLFAISSLDYSQTDAIEKLNQKGNMVIYGPPGTGKSQTIVNIITDALCKNKRVLVVSQKKAALDVVYNRLGSLQERTMYLTDPEKGRTDFYSRTKYAHHSIIENPVPNTADFEDQYKNAKKGVDQEVASLQSISDTLFIPTPFGINLQEIYVKSNNFGKTTFERLLYKNLINNPKLLSFKYPELSSIMRIIIEKRKDDFFYKRLQLQSENPFVAHVKNEINMNTLNSTKSMVSNALTKRLVPQIDIDKFPSTKHLLEFYQREYTKEYALLEQVLDKQGFAMIIGTLINGNTTCLKQLQSVLDNHGFIRSLNASMQELSTAETNILKFCFELSKSEKEFTEAVNKFLIARVYHEAVQAEEQKKADLAKLIEFESIKARILSLKTDQQEIVRNICTTMFKKSYIEMYNESSENKNFLYQINKDKGFLPIRKLMESHFDLMLDLFPCWLLSPENVSTIMPLREGLFDLVLFDEASQVFIENTLPTIYRSKYIVVAGDSKQLRPTALFMKRYMGADFDDMDANTQAALEVESLLDLSTSRYNSVNLNYHYRSQHEELITFSNYAFYDCKLQIAPNITRNVNQKPIERVKVHGSWIDRKNKAEATEVIKLLKKILKTRKSKETIGIITFNAEQESFIEDLIDKECMHDEKFREQIANEKVRKENGESVGLFIKNIENVQGDERDIIIFSIGYARNEQGKVISHFGPLNTEGGENRLNVAVTRAKKKIYVVTSIEPEELNVDGTKNQGPKLFKKYLEYARSVSNGKQNETKLILESLRPESETKTQPLNAMVEEVKATLEKQGYLVEANVGGNNYKLSLAIYDKTLDKFLLGIEFDDAAYRSSPSVLERDVFRSAFMESRGWKIMRVWSRDYWLNPGRVIDRIQKAVKKAKGI